VPTNPLSDFLPKVLPHVPGCPDPLAENHVLEAAIEFCRRTNVWRVDLDPITLAANVSEYDLANPANGKVQLVERVLYNGVPLDPKTPHQLDQDMPGWPTLKGSIVAYYMLTRRKFRIVQIPAATETNAIVVQVSARPTRTATVLDSELYEEYLDEVAAGALSSLLGIPGKEWSSSAKAKERMDEFEKAISTYTANAAQSFSRAPLRTKSIYSLG
jgi:hypothetical protein